MSAGIDICLKCELLFCDDRDERCQYLVQIVRPAQRRYDRKWRRRKRELREFQTAMLEILARLRKVKYDRQRYLQRKANGEFGTGANDARRSAVRL